MSRPPRSAPRLLFAAAIAAWLGSSAAFAQGLRMPTMPAPPSLPSLPNAPALPLASNMNAATLGALAPNLGGLNATNALGSITVCPVTAASGAVATTGVLPSTLSIVSTAPASPILTPQSVSSSAVAAPLVVAPIAAPSITSPFGMTTVSGACAPTILGSTPASTATPPEPLIEPAYSNAGTPPQATEMFGGGLSPLIEVPAPVLFSSSGAVPNSSGVVSPGQ